jgi:hypothetical protein
VTRLTHDSHPCVGCFLQEHRGGRVCPAARDTYALLDLAEAQPQTEALHVAIVRDAQATASLPELVRQDATASSLSRAGLLAAVPSSDPLSHDSREEAPRESVSRTVR